MAWKAAIERRDGPASLVFSRQDLPHQQRGRTNSWRRSPAAPTCSRDCDGAPEAIIIATGSEVELAMDAAAQLAEAGRQVRVVSMPCAEVFEQQDARIPRERAAQRRAGPGRGRGCCTPITGTSTWAWTAGWWA